MQSDALLICININIDSMTSLLRPLFMFVALMPYVVFAQGGTQLGGTQGGTQSGTGGSVTLDNPLGDTTLIGFFTTIIDIVLIFAVPIIVFFIIYAGFLYVTARGNQDTITQAHRALLYALIGGVLILGAKVLIEVIQGTVNAIAS